MNFLKNIFASKASTPKKSSRAFFAAKKNVYTMAMHMPVHQDWLSDDDIQKIELDAVIASSISIRKSATLKKEVVIQSENKAIVKEFMKIFDFGFRQQVLDCAYQGFSIFELNWEERGSLLYPIPVERDYREFSLIEGQLHYMPRFEQIDPLKMAYGIYQPKFNQQMGRPLYHTLFWLRHFKAGSVEFWLEYMEKFGTPWVVGKSADGNKDMMAEQLYAMLGGDVAAIDEDDSIEIVTPSAKGEFKELSLYCDDQIREAILGGNLTGEAKGGSYAAAKVHNDIREDIAMIDEQIAIDMMSQIITKFKELNSLEVDIKIRLKDQDSPNYELAERDVKIAQMSGGKLVLTKEYIEETYHVQTQEIREAKVALPNKTLALSTAKPSDKIEQEGIEVSTKEAEREILSQVEEMFDKAESFDDAIEAIYKAYPTFDTKKIEETIEKLYANSMIYGEAKVMSEHESEL